MEGHRDYFQCHFQKELPVEESSDSKAGKKKEPPHEEKERFEPPY